MMSDKVTTKFKLESKDRAPISSYLEQRDDLVDTYYDVREQKVRIRTNPFGDAVPREEVLARKGINAKTIDQHIERKAHVLHYTTTSSDPSILSIHGLHLRSNDLANAPLTDEIKPVDSTGPYYTGNTTISSNNEQRDDHMEAAYNERKTISVVPSRTAVVTAETSMKPNQVKRMRAKESVARIRTNPFGDAVPREEVLARKGIDAKTFDQRIEKKAHVPHYTSSF